MFGKKDGQPSNTKASDGYSVGTSGGRPSGTVPKPLMDILSVLVVVGPVVPKHLMAILSALVVGRPSGTKASDGY